MDIFGKTCPMCKKAKMKPSGEIKPIKSVGKTGRRSFYGKKKVLKCPKCGYQTIKN